MKSVGSVFVASLLALFTAAPLFAASNSGLWVATVSVNKVGEVNSRIQDSNFDLGVSAVLSDRQLIEKESGNWSFSAQGTLAPNWQNDAEFSGWSSAKAPLGYVLNNGNYEAPAGGTKVSFGSDPADKYPVTYFRKTFTVTDQAGLKSLRLRAWFDDDVRIYLNGVSIYTGNAPAEGGVVESTDLPAAFRELSVPASHLNEGENSLAVEVLGAGGADPDLYFDLELAAIPAAPVDLIGDKSAGWKYHDSATAAPPGWNSTAFSDDGWSGGAALLGFGRITAQTVVQNKPAVYYRKTVSVSDPASYAALNLRLLRDDGAVVYLNGKEIMRSNMPPGAVDFGTAPEQIVGPVDGDRYVTATVPLAAGDLAAGNNVFAVEVHQHPSELAAATTLGELTPAGAGFPLRLLLHVDAAGGVRLLKEAIIMKDSGNNTVVLADSALAPDYSGVALRGNTLVGLRSSAIGYDFNGSSISCSGALGTSGSAECSFALLSENPTNPFLHRFHPDHDNSNEQFSTALQGTAAESFELARKMKLTLSNRYPADPDEPERLTASKPPGWGATLLGGTYGETISGLHRDTLSVSGWFTMRRISASAELKR